MSDLNNGAEPQAQEQATPPVTTQPGTESVLTPNEINTEIPEPFHKNPDWQRIKTQRDEARTLAQEREKELAEFKQQNEQLQARLQGLEKPQAKPEPAEPKTPEIPAEFKNFDDIYSAVRNKLIEEIQAETEAKQRQEEEAKQAEETRRNQINARAETILDELGQERFDEFKSFAEQLVIDEPSVEWTLDHLYSVFKRTGSVEKPKTKVAKPSTSSGKVTPPPTEVGRDLVSFAREEAKRTGII